MEISPFTRKIQFKDSIAAMHYKLFLDGFQANHST